MEGAKEGFQVAVRIIPYLVAILFAIAMFRASGAMDFLARALAPVLGLIGFPPEVLPMAIIRPLTGSGSAGIVVDMIRQYGEDSIFVKMAAVMFGSTETTFYVIAVYFGAVNIRKTRHAVPVGLIADGVGDDHRGLDGAAAVRLKRGWDSGIPRMARAAGTVFISDANDISRRLRPLAGGAGAILGRRRRSGALVSQVGRGTR